MYEKYIEFVVNSYPKITSVACCSFALVSLDGKIAEQSKNYVCHAPLRYAKANTYDVLITSYIVKDATALRFFDFMVDHLYHKWSQYIHLEQTQSGKYYILVTDLDKIPANILFNFCICSRAPVERPTWVAKWATLVDQGIHPGFAFAVCTASVKEDVICEVYQPNVHWCFDNDVSIARLVRGKPDPKIISGKSFKAGPDRCTPTNWIWSGGDDQDLKHFYGKTIQQLWIKWKERLSI